MLKAVVPHVQSYVQCYLIFSNSRFSTSSSFTRRNDNKGFVKNKLYNKSVDKFYQDKGMRHELKLLDVDRSDPAFHHELLRSDTEMEDLDGESSLVQKKFKVNEDPDRVKRILIQKKLFPKPRMPNLLTTVEKQTIRYLHEKDPNEWTVDRLTESFPLTRDGVKGVLKIKGAKNLESLRRQDKQAAENWKLLIKGQLQIDPTLKQHLKSFDRKPVDLSIADQQIVMKRIQDAVSDKKPKLLAPPGEFTNIINSYQLRVKMIKQGRNKENSTEEYANEEQSKEMASLFGPNILDGGPAVGASTPYGETSIMDFGLDFSGDNQMDVEKFREIYLNKLNPIFDPSQTRTNLPFKDNPVQEKTNTAAVAYKKWLQQQAMKSAAVTKNVKKVDATEVLNTLPQPETDPRVRNEDDNSPEVFTETSETTQRKEIFVIKQDGDSQKLTVCSSPESIDIPVHLRHQYNLFQFGDSIYDSEGEFLYRVPGLGA